MNNEKSNNFRRLDHQFMEDLQEKLGLLFPLRDLVIKDSSLSLEIRNNCINIYYRGGNLLKLEKNGHTYKPSFNFNYFSNKGTFEKKLPKEILSIDHLKEWLVEFPLLKSAMDCWFSNNPKFEREFQQMVVWENNSSSIAKSTDYFITDIEYVNDKGARFDMIAIQWNSDQGARKLQSVCIPKLCFIEMKYGDVALSGKSGMLDHVQQWKEHLNPANITDIKDEMLNLFQQKRALNLIAGLKNNNNEVKSFSDEIDCIFLLANHDPEKSGLKKIIEELGQIDIPGVKIKFCISTFMGYGLYKENVINLADFQDRYKIQIYSRNKF